MSKYNPTDGKFVDGQVIEAKDFNDEFILVSEGLVELEKSLNLRIDSESTTNTAYIDKKFTDLVIDGGTF